MILKNSQKEPKVLHIITRWMKSGGAEKNTQVCIDSIKHKYDVHLAIGSDSEVTPENAIKIKSLKREIIPFEDIAAFFQIYKVIKKGKYDIVHTHQSKAGFLGRIAAKLAGVPIVIHTLHGSLFYEGQKLKWFYILLEKFTALFTDWFIAVGKDVRDYHLKYKIGKKEKYSIIRSWIDLDKFRNLIPEQNNIPVVGLVGRIEKIKGIDQAIQAANLILKKYKAKFIFVGQGNYLEQVKGTKNIEFTGFKKDIEQVMNSFDILMSTSKKEGLCQAFVQACLLGKPIVSFNVLGANEMIQDNGFVVNNVEEMAEKISFLLSDLNRARMIGEKGKRLVNEEWSLDYIKNKNLELYEKVCSMAS